jgi:Uma2 family endonuclease
MTTTKPMSAEQFMAIDEDGRFDLIDGEVCRLSPSKSWHSTISGRLVVLLGMYGIQTGRGESPAAEGGYLVAREPDSVLCPDASFVSAEKMASARDRTTDWYLFAPDIAVEVLSPSESRRSIARKVALYLAAGTAQVWVVDTKRETLTMHAANADSQTLTAHDTLDGGAALPGFTLELAQLFR